MNGGRLQRLGGLGGGVYPQTPQKNRDWVRAGAWPSRTQMHAVWRANLVGSWAQAWNPVKKSAGQEALSVAPGLFSLLSLPGS
jgi:hypothetical protein